jgi:predicted MFS family arabinose efflux permease
MSREFLAGAIHCGNKIPSTVLLPGEYPMSAGIDEAARSRWELWLLVASVSFVSIGLAAYEIVPASVTPVIRDSLGVTPAAAGFVVGVMFGTAVLTSLPAGVILDRTNSRTAMLVAVCLGCVAGVIGWLAALRGEYEILIGSRALGGAAYVVVWNAGIDIVSRAASDDYRATAVGVFTASGPVGFALGQGTGPLITAYSGWPTIFLIFTGIPLLGMAVFWPVSRGLGRSSSGAPSVAELMTVVRNRHVLFVGGIGFLGYGLYLFVNSWGSTYLTESVGLSLAVSGLLVAIFPAVGVLARVSSGAISDRLFAGRRRPVVLGSFLVATPILLGFTRFRSIAALIVMLFLAGFAIQITLGLSFTYVQELVEPRVAATAVAFQTSVGLAGAFLAPTVGGAAIETVGFEAAFLGAGGLAILGVGLAWATPEAGV